MAADRETLAAGDASTASGAGRDSGFAESDVEGKEVDTRAVCAGVAGVKTAK